MTILNPRSTGDPLRLCGSESFFVGLCIGVVLGQPLSHSAGSNEPLHSKHRLSVSLFVSEATSARCDTSVSVAVALSHPERARNGGLLRLSVRIARGPSRFWVISGREPQVSATQSKRGQMQCHNSSGVTGFPWFSNSPQAAAEAPPCDRTAV